MKTKDFWVSTTERFDLITHIFFIFEKSVSTIDKKLTTCIYLQWEVELWKYFKNVVSTIEKKLSLKMCPLQEISQ